MEIASFVSFASHSSSFSSLPYYFCSFVLFIHKYSANSIEKVKIGRGNERPLKIEIHMRAEVGFFQVEEVLIPKIQSSPTKSMLELYAGVEGEEMKRYL